MSEACRIIILIIIIIIISWQRGGFVYLYECHCPDYMYMFRIFNMKPTQVNRNFLKLPLATSCFLCPNGSRTNKLKKAIIIMFIAIMIIISIIMIMNIKGHPYYVGDYKKDNCAYC